MSPEIDELKKFLHKKLQVQNEVLNRDRKNHKEELNMLKKELKDTHDKYTTLRLENQEKLIQEIYETKLTVMEENLKEHVDARYTDLQHFIKYALNISQNTPMQVTQQSQLNGPANRGVLVEKSPNEGGGLKTTPPTL